MRLVVFLCALGLICGSAHAQDPEVTSTEYLATVYPGAPEDIIIPLLGAERAYELRNCHVIAAMWPSQNNQQTLDAMRTQVWDGPCYMGLIHGSGAYVTGDTRTPAVALYGRSLSMPPQAGQLSYTVLNESRLLSRMLFAFRATLDGPRESGGMLSISTFNAAGGLAETRSVTLTGGYCSSGLMGMLGNDEASLDRQALAAFRRICRGVESRTNAFFYVTRSVSVPGSNGMTESERNVTACADPTTPAGCTAAWVAALAPWRGDVDAIIAESQRQNAWLRSTLETLYAPVEQQFRAWQDRLDAEYAAEVEAQDAAAAEETAAFERTLTSANAGRLYALADEMIERGNVDRARAALRALLTRFPESNLATTAAERLASLTGRR